MTTTSNTPTGRRTIRRYAHDLYPHPDEDKTLPLPQAVPYLYAQAIGHGTWGTDWGDLGRVPKTGEPANRAELALSSDRIMILIELRSRALIADALYQGMSGEQAWEWAEQRALDESGEIVWERAVHYGVPVEHVKPYPVLNEPDTHVHYGTSAGSNIIGSGVITRIPCPESQCEACTEPDPQEGL